MDAPPGQAAHLGVAISIDPATQRISIMLTFENEGEVVSWTVMDPETAGKVALSVLAQAQEAFLAQQEVDNTPLDDRDKVMERVVMRMTAGTN